MGLFDKFRALFAPKRKPEAPRRLPKRELAPVADIVEQGLLVAEAAVKMTVKNTLIVRALKHKADYSPEQTQQHVKKALEELIIEREKDAANIEQLRAQIQRQGYSTGGETEYGREDSGTLKHRQEVYQGVASELQVLAADQSYLEKIGRSAQELAWSEVGASIIERANHPYYSGGDSPDYKAVREERIKELIENDLQQLLKKDEPTPASEKASWFSKLFKRSSAE